jgi:hypothetical protein
VIVIVVLASKKNGGMAFDSHISNTLTKRKYYCTPVYNLLEITGLTTYIVGIPMKH